MQLKQCLGDRRNEALELRHVVKYIFMIQRKLKLTYANKILRLLWTTTEVESANTVIHKMPLQHAKCLSPRSIQVCVLKVDTGTQPVLGVAALA